jgi:hypothetical protein
MAAARRGFALAAAILAVVLIGALLGGVLFATAEQTRAGAAAADHEDALNACEAAIAMTITDPGLRLPDSIGVEGDVSVHVGGRDPEIIVYITRLDAALYSILAESVSGSGGAGGVHRVGVVIRSTIAEDRSITIVPISERPWFEAF